MHFFAAYIHAHDLKSEWLSAYSACSPLCNQLLLWLFLKLHCWLSWMFIVGSWQPRTKNWCKGMRAILLFLVQYLLILPCLIIIQCTIERYAECRLSVACHSKFIQNYIGRRNSMIVAWLSTSFSHIVANLGGRAVSTSTVIITAISKRNSRTQGKFSFVQRFISFSLCWPWDRDINAL